MLKKDIVFGSVVLLMAALFTLAGCSQATDSGGVTLYRENHLFGTADWEDVARAVKAARDTNSAVVLTDQLNIVGIAGATTVADFEDLPIRVEGVITIDGTNPVIVNAAHAVLEFAGEARVNIAAGGAFIYSGSEAHIFTTAATGYKVKYVTNPMDGTQGTDGRVAVSNYTLGPDFSNLAPHVKFLYVLDKITVSAASAVPNDGLGPNNPMIFALGNVDLTENNSASFASLANFVLTRDSVLTSSAPGGVTITVPDAAVLPTIKATVPINVVGAGTTTSLTINRVEGPETVAVSTATSITTALTINSVAADGKLTVASPTISGAVGIGSNAGSVTMSAPTAFSSTGITIGNNAATGSITLIGVTSYTAPVNLLAATGRNSGVINVTAPTINGKVTVDNNDGDLNLNASAAVTAGAAVANNSGTITVASPSITTVAITVPSNTGEIVFSQDVSGFADFLAVGNKGLITFRGTFTNSGALAADKITGSGTVVFDGLATLGAAATINCDTVFNGGVATGANALDLYGNATLGYGKKITSGGAAVTLGAGKRLLVGENPALAAGSANVVITLLTSGTLTAGTELPTDNDDEDTFVGYKTISVGGAIATITSGDLRVPGALKVAFAQGLTVTGSLTIEDGGILAFGNDAGYAANIGFTRIAGVAGDPNGESRLTAIGGPVTLSPVTNVTTISGNGSTLAVVEMDTFPLITLDPGTPAGGKTLNIKGANLDLLLGGSLTINGFSSTANIVQLIGGQNPGKITLGDSPTYRLSLSGGHLEGGTYDAVISGNGEVYGPDEEIGTEVGYISGALGSNLILTGTIDTGNNVIIEAGATVDA